MSFNFGTTSAVFGDTGYAFQVQELNNQLTAAKDALAASEKKLSVTRNTLTASRAQLQAVQSSIKPRQAKPKAQMDPDEYDQISDLQQEVQDLKEKLKEQRKLIEERDRKNGELEETIITKDFEISDNETDITTLRTGLEMVKADIEEEKLAHKATDDLLHKAYADTKAAEQKLQTARIERDNAEAAHKETELKLESLRTQWEEEQEKIEDYDRTKEILAVMETQQTDLLNEVDNHHAQMGDKDHLINVKDARIANLEDQLQKALTVVRTAEAAAEASKTSTTEPAHIGIVGDSLQDELDELGSDGEDFEHAGSEHFFEQQTLVGVIPHATIDIPPIEPAPQKLSLSNVSTTINTTPVEASKPVLSISGISSVAISPTEAQKQPLSISGISSVATAPIKPIEIQTKNVGVMATPELRTSGIQTVETYPIEAASTKAVVAPTPTPASKKTTLWPIISGVLALLCVFLWLQLRAWKAANIYDGYSAGAYGRPTRVLGMWTIGGDIGGSWMSEMVTKHMAGAVYGFEEWIGADGGGAY